MPVACACACAVCLPGTLEEPEQAAEPQTDVYSPRYGESEEEEPWQPEGQAEEPEQGELGLEDSMEGEELRAQLQALQDLPMHAEEPEQGPPTDPKAAPPVQPSGRRAHVVAAGRG